MSNDIRNPVWVRQVLGSLGSGAESPRAVLLEMLQSLLTTPATETATTTQLADITAEINTSDNKVAGYMVWNSTTGIPVWADGSGAGDTWSGADGLVDHTPV